MGIVVGYFVFLASVFVAVFGLGHRMRRFHGVPLSILLIVFLLAFLIADVRLSVGEAEPSVIDWLTDLPMRMMFLAPDDMECKAYSDTLRTILSTLLAGITLWFAAILPWLVIGRLRNDIQDQQIVVRSPVKTVGTDDIETMSRYYLKAEDIKVFSGDFDWLVATSDLRTLVLGLAQQNKIILVSYKKPSQVESAWKQAAKSKGTSEVDAGSILNELRQCFRFHDRPFKFTLIQYSQNLGAFLSLVPGGPTGHDMNIGVVSSKNPEANALYYMVKKLSEAACEDLKTWDEAEEAEKNGTKA